MPAITDRSSTTPILKTLRIGHGTLECADIAKTRRFYEEVLGFDVLQTSPRSLMIRHGTDHTYAVVESGKTDKEMNRLNHNGIDVGSPAEVDAAYLTLLQIKDEYGIREIQKPRTSHGDHSLFFCDLDGNWWEIVAVREGGYAADYSDTDRDLTGRHDLARDIKLMTGPHAHVHDPEFRRSLKSSKEGT